MLAGTGSYNSHYVDGTMALKTKNDVSFTVTGRVYQSDGINLSAYPNWDGSPAFKDSNYIANLTQAVPHDSVAKYTSGGYYTSKGDTIVPTALGIKKLNHWIRRTTGITRLSKTHRCLNLHCLTSTFLRKYWFTILSLDFRYWNQDEGMVGDLPDNYGAINSAYSNWQVRSFRFYSQYDKNINEKVAPLHKSILQVLRLRR
jgi:hypothetical protein